MTIVGLGMLLLSARVEAGSVPVKKPSEIVSLRTSGTTGCNGSGRVAFSTVAFGGAPFEVPAGAALLVTDITFIGTGIDVLQVELNDPTPTSAAVAYVGLHNIGTKMTGGLHLQTPIVVRSGQTLCIGQSPPATTLAATLTGTLTRDK